MKIVSKNFKEAFDVLKTFKELGIDDLTFRTDLNGFRVKNASRDMVAYLDVYFKSIGFEEFETNNEILTVNLETFLDFTFSKTDKITIANQENKLLLKAENGTVTVLNLPLLEKPTEENPVSIETIKTDTSLIEIDFKAFKTILKNYLKEDSVNFELKEDCLKINTDRGQETKLFKGTDIIKEIRGNAKSRYAISYLKLLTKLDTKTFTNIKVEFKNDFPIVFTLENDYIKIEYVIAPRIIEE